ncbi:MAG: histidine kinase [Planctomycetota bacterium]|nr:histidine kinase [Planctomycetota bacterium]
MSESKAQDMVLMLSGDLMFSSRVKSAAERFGKRFRISGRLPDDDVESIDYVIVDLSTRSGLLPEIVEQCAERCPDAHLLAYGPHVHVDRLKAARDAGISPVLTNGQFDAALATLFQ